MAVITSSVAKITFGVADIIFKMIIITSSVVKIPKVAVITSSMVNITFVVAEISGCNQFFGGQDNFFSVLDIFLKWLWSLLQRPRSLCSDLDNVFQWLTSAC